LTEPVIHVHPQLFHKPAGRNALSRRPSRAFLPCQHLSGERINRRIPPGDQNRWHFFL